MLIMFNYFEQTKLCSTNDITVSDNKDNRPVLKFSAIGDDDGAYELRVPKYESEIIPDDNKDDTFIVKCGHSCENDITLCTFPNIKGIKEAERVAYELTREKYVELLRKTIQNGGNLDLSSMDTEVLRYYVEQYNFDRPNTGEFRLGNIHESKVDTEKSEDDEPAVDFSLLDDIEELDLSGNCDDIWNQAYDERDGVSYFDTSILVSADDDPDFNGPTDI